MTAPESSCVPVIDRPLIAAVHATPASVSPLRAVLADELPGAQLWNLIDDRLGPDADALGGELSARLRDRMLNLIRHCITGGADAVVIACSMYGDVRELAEKLFTTPVFASDTDMMTDIVRAAPRRVAVLASLQGAVGDTTARLSAMLAAGHHRAEVVPVFCAGAAEAAARADVPALVAALATGVDSATGPFDMVCIAQYSLSPAADELAAKTGLPVASPTRSAARAIARRLGAP
jgi:Asp/Glu/hydantoin racemase